MAKKNTAVLDEDSVDVNEAIGVMGAMGGDELGPCPCCSGVPKPHYVAGTPRARKMASNGTSFVLETEANGHLFIDRVGHAFKLEEDGSARERVGHVREFIDVPVKTRKVRRKNKKSKK